MKVLDHTKWNLRKLCLLAILATIGYVLSTFVWIPKMAPLQHMVNVIAAVLLGPWGALGCAAMTGIMRMLLNGSTILAFTGAIFGAFLAGVGYRVFGKVIGAVVGEVIGTGIISALVSVPVMRWVYGTPDLYALTYVPFFFVSSMMGAIMGYMVVKSLARAKVIQLNKETDLTYKGEEGLCSKQS
ncbi:MAG: energy coupling factor transporter S component ThiW [Cellulosilyticaceae bacterium]